MKRRRCTVPSFRFLSRGSPPRGAPILLFGYDWSLTLLQAILSPVLRVSLHTAHRRRHWCVVDRGSDRPFGVGTDVGGIAGRVVRPPRRLLRSFACEEILRQGEECVHRHHAHHVPDADRDPHPSPLGGQREEEGDEQLQAQRPQVAHSVEGRLAHAQVVAVHEDRRPFLEGNVPRNPEAETDAEGQGDFDGKVESAGGDSSVEHQGSGAAQSDALKGQTEAAFLFVAPQLAVKMAWYEIAGEDPKGKGGRKEGHEGIADALARVLEEDGHEQSHLADTDHPHRRYESPAVPAFRK
mmetsp:Transcript_58838/g.80313  ORF Transcript_58838/g.80313 Transcript_58838/m.80313 type:complete len:296 (+) Transcript_58838:133-1020(+)